MPIIVPKDIPATETLKKENIFVITENRALTQDIRPIEVAIINLMPTKEVTETQLMRLLSNTPLQVNITLIKTKSYTSRHTSQEHLDKFYKNFEDVKDKKFDGMIITGAPVEEISFEEVLYWEELKEIFDFAKSNVTSTMFICWGAQAGLKYFYNIDKHLLKKKLFGVYSHKKLEQYDMLLKGTDDYFYIPHSRHTTIKYSDVKKNKDLVILAASKKAGVGIVRSKDNKFLFITGHIEYDRDTLEIEYKRDLNKGLKIDKPENYYIGKSDKVNMKWLSTANLIYMNWLNHYVYQLTPYNIENI